MSNDVIQQIIDVVTKQNHKDNKLKILNNLYPMKDIILSSSSSKDYFDNWNGITDQLIMENYLVANEKYKYWILSEHNPHVVRFYVD